MGGLTFIYNKIFLELMCFRNEQPILSENSFAQRKINEKLCQQLLFARNLEIGTKGESILNKIKSVCDKEEILEHNIMSEGTCQIRFYQLFDIVIEFLENKDKELRCNPNISKNDTVYLTDLYKFFKDVNL